MNFSIIIPQTPDILLYCLLGLLAVVEGPVAVLMSGAAASSGLILPLPAYFSVVLGNLTADMGWYTLGRFSSRRGWMAPLVRKAGGDVQKIAQMEGYLQRSAPRLLFLSKLTVGLPIPTLVATGLSRVPVRRWVSQLVAGELIKSAALGAVGYLYAAAIQQASRGVQLALWTITAVLVVAALVWFKLRRNPKS